MVSSKKSVSFAILLLLLFASNISFSSNSTQSSEKTTIIAFYLPQNEFSIPSLNGVNDVNLTILFNADFHGWMEPHDGYGGAATMMGYFKSEGYTYDNDSFLILGGGDHNTGPAEATLSKGEAVIDVMNAMNYSAAAIGNHEFDFGIEIMKQQKENATFPLLACNIFEEGSTNYADFTVPYVVQEHASIKVGIIGLTLDGQYAKNEADFDLLYYEAAVRNCIGDVESDGAELIILLTHVPPNALEELASDISDLGIELFLGGHSHSSRNILIGNTLVVATQPYSQEYAKINISFDNVTKSISSKSAELITNTEGGVIPDTSVQQVVDYWVDRIDASEVITYASNDVHDGYPESAIGNLVTDGFRYYFGWSHNFGITNNGGGFRDHFRQGDITLGDIVSVIPFDNSLLELTMTGEEILQMIQNYHGQYSFSGIRYRFYQDPELHIHSVQIWKRNKFRNIDPSKNYTGLISDFNWWQRHYGQYSAVDTGVNYRDAVIEYFRTLTDISLHSYDDRILETDIELSETDNYYWFSLFTIIPLLVIGMVIVRTIKRRKIA